MHAPATDATARRFAWRALLVSLGLLNVARLYPVFVSETLVAGQAAFEPSPNGVVIRYGDRTDDRMFPLMVRARGDTVVVGQGNTIVVPLDPIGNLSIRSADDSRAPWVLLGVEQPDPSAASAEDVRAGHRLAAPQMVIAVDGRLQAVPWDPASWTQDVHRLTQLAHTCSTTAPLDIRRQGDRVHLTLGDCEGDVEAAPNADPSTWRIAVAGETRGAFVRREGDAWDRHRELIAPFLLVFLLLYGAQAAAFGLVAAALLGVPCLIAGLWAPVAAAFVWIALGVIAAVALSVYGLRIGIRRAPVLTFVGVGLALAATWLGLFSILRDRSRPQPSPLGGTSACLLTGYSTAGDTTLPDRTFGVRAQLDAECPRCRQHTGRWAEAGQAFGWFALHLCSPDLPAETRIVTHLGGSNDDFFVAHGPIETLVFVFLFCVRNAMAPPDPLRMVDTLALAASRQLARSESLVQDIDTVMDCVHAHHVRFFYFHDFLAMDLDGRHSADRRALLDARRHAVEAHGETFVDLQRAVADRAGVHWFNDFIHLSGVGHQQVAALMCATISETSAEPGAAPGS